MTIERIIDGKKITIELTDRELEEAYRIRDEYYKIMDIRSRIYERLVDAEGLEGCDIDGTPIYNKWDQELPPISATTTEATQEMRQLWENPQCLVDPVLNTLDNNDSYWESYWQSIEYVLDEEFDYYD